MPESYDHHKLRRPIAVQDIGVEGAALYHVFGVDYTKRGNLHVIEDNVVAYVSGNSVIFQNVINHSRNYLIGLDEGGIGCIVVHPSRYEVYIILHYIYFFK
jgi:hypothetical protein